MPSCSGTRTPMTRCGMNGRVTLRSLRTSGTYILVRVQIRDDFMGHEWRDDYFEAVRDDRQNADDWSWPTTLFIRPLTDYFTGRNEFAYVGWSKGWERRRRIKRVSRFVQVACPYRACLSAVSMFGLRVRVFRFWEVNFQIFSSP